MSLEIILPIVVGLGIFIFIAGASIFVAFKTGAETEFKAFGITSRISPQRSNRTNKIANETTDQQKLDNRQPAAVKPTKWRDLTESWAYTWEDQFGNFQSSEVRPSVAEKIVSEISKSFGESPIIVVKGEMGVGKSTLSGRLLTAFQQASSEIAELALVYITEGGDNEMPEEFARRLQPYVGTRPLIILGRPATIESTLGVLEPINVFAVVTLQTFQPGSIIFEQCFDLIQLHERVSDNTKLRAKTLAAHLPENLQTPFYFKLLAKSIDRGNFQEKQVQSPLQIFSTLVKEIPGAGHFLSMVTAAQSHTHSLPPISGIIGSNGSFVHSGYRNVVLAAAVIEGLIGIDDLVRCRLPIPAFELLLDHCRIIKTPELIDQLEDFSCHGEASLSIPNSLYLQALAADTLAKIGRSKSCDAVRRTCMSFVPSTTSGASLNLPPLRPQKSFWVDLSDSLTLLGDPRLEEAAHLRYGPNSGYFSHLEHQHVNIGTNSQVSRMDTAKPLLPFKEQAFEVGPIWISNFLVTVELFEEFYSDPDRNSFFEGTGKQWIQQSDEICQDITDSFNVSSQRCFWKEIQDAMRSSSDPHAGEVLLAASRLRALGRSDRSKMLKNRTIRKGTPANHVNWWEAIAFCRWWQTRILPNSGFEHDCHVDLLTDAEWEAVRRIYYENASPEDLLSRRNLAAHLRPAEPSSQVNFAGRPLHVGLFPVPAGVGPTDMIGNVWEWTKSSIYGQIVEATVSDSKFGYTRWDNGDGNAERIAHRPLLEDTLLANDLRYRTVRGSSFYSRDFDSPWDASYRLCDPPYQSFSDLGFRIVVRSE